VSIVMTDPTTTNHALGKLARNWICVGKVADFGPACLEDDLFMAHQAGKRPVQVQLEICIHGLTVGFSASGKHGGLADGIILTGLGDSDDLCCG
jgi:hypothetical protein